MTRSELGKLFSSLLIVVALLFSIRNLFSQDHRREGSVPVQISTRFRLHAELASDIAKAGSPIVATLRLKNVSHRLGQFLEMGEYVDYEVLVTDPSGKEVLRTELGKHLVEDERWGSAKLHELQAGEEVEQTLDLAKIYALKPGRYFTRFMRVVSAGAKIRGCEKAVSNAIAFTVME